MKKRLNVCAVGRRQAERYRADTCSVSSTGTVMPKDPRTLVRTKARQRTVRTVKTTRWTTTRMHQRRPSPPRQRPRLQSLPSGLHRPARPLNATSQSSTTTTMKHSSQHPWTLRSVVTWSGRVQLLMLRCFASPASAAEPHPSYCRRSSGLCTLIGQQGRCRRRRTVPVRSYHSRTVAQASAS